MSNLSLWDNLEIREEDLLDVPEDTEEIIPVEEFEVDDDDDIVIENATETEEEDELPQEKEPKKTVRKVEKVEPTVSVENASAINAFAQDLKQWEFLPNITEDELKNIKSPDDLADVLKKQLTIVQEEWQNEFIEALDNQTKGAISHVLNGGKLTEFVETVSTRFTNYTESQIKNSEDIQKKIVSEYYKRKGLPDRKIAKLINESLDLEEDALDFSKEILEEDNAKEASIKESTKKRKEQEQELIQRRTETIRKNIVETKEFIPGRRISTEVKQKIFDNVPNVLGKINQDLEKYAPILAYLDYYKLLEGDFSKIIKEETTRGVSNLSKVLAGEKSSVDDNNDADDLYKAAKWSVERYKNKNTFR